jgi:haloacetate dehalogenase
VHAVCEDYRASFTIDVTIKEQSKGVKAKQPLLALWGQKGTVRQLFDVIGMWRERASHVSGQPLPCGHLIPEEDPQGLLDALSGFLRA